MAKLTLYFPEKYAVPELQGKTFELDPDGHDSTFNWILGRRESCFLPVKHEQVSGHHCALRYTPMTESWELCDLASTNGTWLNGKKLAPKNWEPIAPDDRFFLAMPPLQICVVENEGDTLSSEETFVSAEPSLLPVKSEPPTHTRTFADVVWAAFNWATSADTKLGVVLRLVAIALATALVIVLISLT